MIINAILSLITMILGFIVNLFPSFDIGLDVAGYIAPLSNVVGYVDSFISLKALAMCVAAVFIVDNFGFVVKIVSFIWEKIPLI